jgi:hypothetical protein
MLWADDEKCQMFIWLGKSSVNWREQGPNRSLSCYLEPFLSSGWIVGKQEVIRPRRITSVLHVIQEPCMTSLLPTSTR